MSTEKYRQEAERWLLQARADLRAAEASAAAGSYEWACFQSQQAGEKALKAFWLYQSLDPWGHSLTKLIGDFPDPAIRASLASLVPRAKHLDKLYIPTRYPNGLPDLIPADVYTEDDARQAVETARVMLDALSALMGL